MCGRSYHGPGHESALEIFLIDPGRLQSEESCYSIGRTY